MAKNKYDAAFFQMIKQRGEELFPLDPPFGWCCVESGAGIVYATENDRVNDSHTWWLSWIKTTTADTGSGLHACTQEYSRSKQKLLEVTATQEQLEKMSGDGIVSLLFSHFTFMDKGDGCELPKQDLQHDTGTMGTDTGD